jgi:hypothetical protein
MMYIVIYLCFGTLWSIWRGTVNIERLQDVFEDDYTLASLALPIAFIFAVLCWPRGVWKKLRGLSNGK